MTTFLSSFIKPDPAHSAASCLLALLIVSAFAAAARAEDPIPKALPDSHFTKLLAHSPFAPPTPIAVASAPAPPPPPPPVFDKYTVALLMQQGNGYIATLNNKDTSEHIRVRTNPSTDLAQKDNDEGISIASVEWSSDLSQTKVTLRNEQQQFGVIGFDPSGMSAAPNPTVVAPQHPIVRPAMQAPNTFHPPPGSAPNPNLPNQNGVRRGAVIRSPGPIPRPGQPGVNFTASPRMPGPAIPGARPLASKGNDDDDDDDN